MIILLLCIDIIASLHRGGKHPRDRLQPSRSPAAHVIDRSGGGAGPASAAASRVWNCGNRGDRRASHRRYGPQGSLGDVAVADAYRRVGARHCTSIRAAPALTRSLVRDLQP